MRTTPFSIVSIGNRGWTATPPSQGAFRSRSVEIDSLRAFAVLLVLWTHTVGTTLRIGEHRIDLWDIERLFACDCSPARAARLATMNREQRVAPAVVCSCRQT